MDDRRTIADRRKQSTPFLSRHTFLGRRRSLRREEDRQRHFFVDHYSLGLFVTLLLLLMLSIVDAYLTLALVKVNNATEINPVMALYLNYGSVTFFLEKLLFTSTAISIFCVFNHFAITRISLAVAIILYGAVVFYEVHLMYNLFP